MDQHSKAGRGDEIRRQEIDPLPSRRKHPPGWIGAPRRRAGEDCGTNVAKPIDAKRRGLLLRWSPGSDVGRRCGQEQMISKFAKNINVAGRTWFQAQSRARRYRARRSEHPQTENDYGVTPRTPYLSSAEHPGVWSSSRANILKKGDLETCECPSWCPCAAGYHHLGSPRGSLAEPQSRGLWCRLIYGYKAETANSTAISMIGSGACPSRGHETGNQPPIDRPMTIARAECRNPPVRKDPPGISSLHKHPGVWSSTPPIPTRPRKFF